MVSEECLVIYHYPQGLWSKLYSDVMTNAKDGREDKTWRPEVQCLRGSAWSKCPSSMTCQQEILAETAMLTELKVRKS